ncbi:MAG: glycosyltransferase [Alphaproteobacteria bacterium]|nr:glycosyltransferase [Alphaproteobacteria bacterium]
MTWLDWLTVGPASIPLALNLLNARWWPRGTAVAPPSGPVSVLIPARDEEANIEAAVTAALALDPPAHEVIVCDDGSTDQTPAILARLAARDPRLRVIGAPPLPEGWVGKPHACHVLGEAASGALLLFVDADVRLAPDALGRVEHLLQRFHGRVLTAFPGQALGTWAERLLVPLLPLTFTSWMPLDLVHAHTNPAFLVVNGQILAFRREAYEAVGGFASVRAEIVDDMAICRRAKEHDQRVVFADGQDLGTCRMYRGGAEVWRGFSKNLYEGLGGRPLALLAVLAVYGTAFVLPYGRLLSDLATGAPAGVALVGVGLNLATRAHLARRLHHGVVSVLLHPLAVLALLAMAINSARWVHADAIAWRGRTYGRRTAR